MNEDHEQFEDDAALTQSLRKWGESLQATDEQLARMRQAITSAPADDGTIAISDSVGQHKLHGAWSALGLVAALLIAFALLLPGIPQRQANLTTIGESANVRSPANFAIIDERQVQQKQALVAELNSVFPQQWQWVSESSSELRMEVGRQTTDVGDTVAVRIIVAQRSIGETHWIPVWSVDCLARGEEVVRLQPNGDGFHGTIVLWTYPMGDNLVAIDSDVDLHDTRLGGRDLRASFHGAQQERVPQQISQVKSDHTEYQIFQTVANIREEAL